MELRHDSTDHIKADITAEQQRRRREIIDDARHHAEQEIARREHQAHKDGTTLLNKQQDSADKLAEHRYHRKRNDINEALRKEKHRVKQRLKEKVWSQLLDECNDKTIIKHLKQRVKTPIEDEALEDYQITTDTTGDTYTVTAANNTKKYQATLSEIVNDVIKTYWDTAIRQ